MTSTEFDPSDGNNDQDHAQAIGLQEVVEGVVCPEDSFDFYTFEIAEGEIVAGTITLDGTRQGTTLRLEGEASGRLYDAATVDDPYDLVILLGSDTLVADTYYIRVYHYQVYAFDHEYTLIMDLYPTECFPDGNEEPENATDIAFGTTVKDWLCPDDRLDIYRFHVDLDLEATGGIELTPYGEELSLYLYGSDWTQYFYVRTIDPETGKMEIDFAEDEGDRLDDGDYYIGVFLPLRIDAAVQYDLRLKRAGLGLGPSMTTMDEVPGKVGRLKPGMVMKKSVLPDEGAIASTHAYAALGTEISEVPWPNTRGGSDNTGRSTFIGPTVWLYTESDIPKQTDTDNYRGLLVGKNPRVFCISRPSNVLYAFNAHYGSTAWSVQTGSKRPACLDGEGNIYYIHEDEDTLLKCTGQDNTLMWSRGLAPDGDMAVELVGARVYASTLVTPGPLTFILAYTKDGNLMWKAGPMDGRITGMAEDIDRGLVYIQTSQCLYQYNWGGMQNWRIRFPVMDEPSNTPGPFPPIVASNGDVWAFYQRTLDAFTYTKDKTLVSTMSFTEDTRPYSVCLDADDRLYIMDRHKIYCYEDWNDLVWQFDPTDPWPRSTFTLRNIALDGEGHLYTWFHEVYQPPRYWDSGFHEYVYPHEQHYDGWRMIDIEDGTITDVGGEMEMDTFSHSPPGTDPLGTYGGMAIGDLSQLIMLHESGECCIVWGYD